MKTGSSLESATILHKISTYLVAAVWLINGLFCKVLNLAPRHKDIVAGILGSRHAGLLTQLIGFSEILMFVWIISRIRPFLCAATQVCIILLMNILEFCTVPDLLLFGRINLLIALAFCSLIYYNEFILYRKIQPAK